MNRSIVFLILFVHLTYSTVNNKHSMSFSRRRQLDEAFRRLNRQCEQKESCQKLNPTIIVKNDYSSQQKEFAEINMINCIRRCISSQCYRNIYEKDPLELGEIDVRTSQFKTCWIKEQKI